MHMKAGRKPDLRGKSVHHSQLGTTVIINAKKT